MLQPTIRRYIMTALGEAVDDLVRQRYPGSSQEPVITSRIGQRLEDLLDGRQVGEYRFHILTQDVPDRGPNSLERLIGADLYLSMSLEGPDGFDKGLLVQTKFDTNLSRAELNEQCRKMKVHTNSAYVWVYGRNGITVVSADAVSSMMDNTLNGLTTRTASGFFGRILDCNSGSRDLGIAPIGDRFASLERRLTALRAEHAVDIDIRRTASRRRDRRSAKPPL